MKNISKNTLTGLFISLIAEGICLLVYNPKLIKGMLVANLVLFVMVTVFYFGSDRKPVKELSLGAMAGLILVMIPNVFLLLRKMNLFH